jgi:hypothetical protein
MVKQIKSCHFSLLQQEFDSNNDVIFDIDNSIETAATTEALTVDSENLGQSDTQDGGVDKNNTKSPSLLKPSRFMNVNSIPSVIFVFDGNQVDASINNRVDGGCETNVDRLAVMNSSAATCYSSAMQIEGASMSQKDHFLTLVNHHDEIKNTKKTLMIHDDNDSYDCDYGFFTADDDDDDSTRTIVLFMEGKNDTDKNHQLTAFSYCTSSEWKVKTNQVSRSKKQHSEMDIESMATTDDIDKSNQMYCTSLIKKGWYHVLDALKSVRSFNFEEFLIHENKLARDERKLARHNRDNSVSSMCLLHFEYFEDY